MLHQAGSADLCSGFCAPVPRNGTCAPPFNSHLSNSRLSNNHLGRRHFCSRKGLDPKNNRIDALISMFGFPLLVEESGVWRFAG